MLKNIEGNEFNQISENIQAVSLHTIESEARRDELISIKADSLITLYAFDWSIRSLRGTYLHQSERRTAALMSELG